MRDKRFISLLLLILLVAIASFFAIVAYLSINWPLYFFPALLILFAVSLVMDYRSKKRTLCTLNCAGYVEIADSRAGTYTGIYCPHWEIEHIQIPLAKRSIFGFPTFESWDPRFTGNVPEPGDDLSSRPRQFIIVFVGTPSKRGQYGHMGMMDREVEIESVLELKPVGKAVD